MDDKDITIHVVSTTQNDSHMQADLGLVHMKIQEIVQLLTNFSSQPQEKSRSSYLSELKELISTYYEYNSDLSDYFVSLFAPSELINFLEASQTPRPLIIRINSMKVKRRELAQTLIQKGVNLDPAGDWNKIGLKIIDSQVPIGATTEYLAGQYILQSASSFLPVMALAPKPGERVLDMCAAPGGKTTHIAQIMKNTGVIVANEFNPDRCLSVKGNIHRMGFSNVIITNYDGRKIGNHLTGFDRVLVDAPCSGLGVIWKDPSVKALRSLKDIKRNAHIQKELLLAAIDVVNAKSSNGGFIVYSTCSVSVEENEEVVDYALKNRRVKLVDTGLSIGEPGFHKFKGKIYNENLVKCKRIYPHVYNMEGFFIAKLKKIDSQIPNYASKPHTGEKREKNKKNKSGAEYQDESNEKFERKEKKNKKNYSGEQEKSDEKKTEVEVKEKKNKTVRDKSLSKKSLGKAKSADESLTEKPNRKKEKSKKAIKEIGKKNKSLERPAKFNTNSSKFQAEDLPKKRPNKDKKSESTPKLKKQKKSKE